MGKSLRTQIRMSGENGIEAGCQNNLMSLSVGFVHYTFEHCSYPRILKSQISYMRINFFRY